LTRCAWLLVLCSAGCYDFDVFDHLDGSANRADGGEGMWTTRTSTLRFEIFAVGGYDDSAFAGGVSGALIHSIDGGQTWANTATPAAHDVHAVFGDASGYWVGGEDGIFFRSATGSMFTTQKPAADVNTYAIAGRSATDLYAGLSLGELAHFDGTTWSTLPPPAGSIITITSVGVMSNGVGVAAGSKGTIITLPELVASTPLKPYGATIWGAATVGGLFYLVGDTGAIFHSTDRADWIADTTPTTQSLRALVNVGNLLFAVGTGGVILRSVVGSSVWTADESPTTNNLDAAWVSASGDVVAVGAAGTILHWP
jgi:hypothetical protein